MEQKDEVVLNNDSNILVVYGPIEQGEFRGKNLYFIMQGAAPEKWQLEVCEFTMKRFAGLYGFSYKGMITNAKEARVAKMA